MTRRRHRPVLFLAAALGLAGCQPEPPVVLGVATSAAFVDAAVLAVEHARAAGLDVPVDTMLTSEASNRAAPAIEVSERLVATPGMVVVIGHSNSAASLAASQLYNRAGVVQIAPTATASAYSRAGPFSFRMVPPDDRQGAFLADVLRRDLPAGAALAVLYVNDDYGRGLRDAFMAALDTAALSTPLDLPFVETDLMGPGIDPVVDALARVQPEALVWLGRPGGLDRLLGPLRAALGPVAIYGGDALASVGLQVTLDDRWRGVRYVDFADLDATPAGHRFVREYEERFGRRPSVPEALTYDATRLALDGIAAGARTGDELRNYLRGFGRDRPSYSGITGTVRFNDEGDVDRSYVLVSVLQEERP